jgi:hypothetical protein
MLRERVAERVSVVEPLGDLVELVVRLEVVVAVVVLVTDIERLEEPVDVGEAVVVSEADADILALPEAEADVETEPDPDCEADTLAENVSTGVALFVGLSVKEVLRVVFAVFDAEDVVDFVGMDVRVADWLLESVGRGEVVRVTRIEGELVVVAVAVFEEVPLALIEPDVVGLRVSRVVIEPVALVVCDFVAKGDLVVVAVFAIEALEVVLMDAE